MDISTNDTADLEPRTTFEGPALEFDFEALRIGVAEYEEGRTGCTVFYFPAGVATAVDVRGGSVGTMGGYGWNHAICFAGGSLYGLEAASGVAAELFAAQEYRTDFERIALVSGAIIYDYGPRSSAIYPDKALGRAALKTARPGVFPLGARGAGRSATVGSAFDFSKAELSGQGGAFREVGPTKVVVFTVVNAAGAIMDRNGQVVRGNLDRRENTRRHPVDELERSLAAGGSPQPPAGNTTLTLVATNRRLSERMLDQLARQVHSSMARAIQPFHTALDGDVLYAVTTNEVPDPALNEAGLGVIASELAWDAVLSIPS